MTKASCSAPTCKFNHHGICISEKIRVAFETDEEYFPQCISFKERTKSEMTDWFVENAINERYSNG